MTTVTPFDLPQIILPKVKLQDVLQVLRERLNKGYMPSATGEVQYNSKPYYYSASRFGTGDYRAEPLKDFPTFPNPDHLNTSHEVASFDNEVADRLLFAILTDDRIEVIVNLKTCDTLVRLAGSGNTWMRWLDVPEQEIAVDMILLKERADIFL